MCLVSQDHLVISEIVVTPTAGEFIEIYVECDLSTCEERDPKGLYKKARAGEIPEFTGISAPYEVPENPELIINTSEVTDVYENARRVIAYLEKNGILEINELAQV